MRFGIYLCQSTASRSVMSAVLIAEVELDEWPEDEAELADSYGGDFIQMIEDDEENDG
jgi:hypothetical protein